MTKWLLTYLLMSSGVHQQWFIDRQACIEEMKELEIITKQDLFLARCEGPDGEEESSYATRDIGP